MKRVILRQCSRNLSRNYAIDSFKLKNQGSRTEDLLRGISQNIDLEQDPNIALKSMKPAKKELVKSQNKHEEKDLYDPLPEDYQNKHDTGINKLFENRRATKDDEILEVIQGQGRDPYTNGRAKINSIDAKLLKQYNRDFINKHRTPQAVSMEQYYVEQLGSREMYETIVKEYDHYKNKYTMAEYMSTYLNGLMMGESDPLLLLEKPEDLELMPIPGEDERLLEVWEFAKLRQDADYGYLKSLRSEVLEMPDVETKHTILPRRLLKEYIRVAKSRQGSIISTALTQFVRDHFLAHSQYFRDNCPDDFSEDMLHFVEQHFERITSSPIESRNEFFLESMELDQLKQLDPLREPIDPISDLYKRRLAHTQDVTMMNLWDHLTDDLTENDRLLIDSEKLDRTNFDPVLISKYKPYLMDDPTWGLIHRLLNHLDKNGEAGAFKDSMLTYMWTRLGGTSGSVYGGYDLNVIESRLQKMYPRINPLTLQKMIKKVLHVVGKYQTQQSYIHRVARTPTKKEKIKTGPKVNDGVERSKQVLTDEATRNTTSTIYRLAEYIGKPRPKIIGVLDSLSLLTRRRINQEQFENITLNAETKIPDHYRNDFEYLYDVLMPIHSFKKEKKPAPLPESNLRIRIKGGKSKGVGQRKSSTALATIQPGSGGFTVNGRSHTDYFDKHDLRTVAEPLSATNCFNQFDIRVTVRGGGTTGQAEAVRLAVSRALGSFVPGFGRALQKAGLMRRDKRLKERKKPGQRGARAKFQWVRR